MFFYVYDILTILLLVLNHIQSNFYNWSSSLFEFEYNPFTLCCPIDMNVNSKCVVWMWRWKYLIYDFHLFHNKHTLN